MNTNMNASPIAVALFAIVSAVQEKGKESRAASGKEKSAVAAVRDYASLTADEGIASDTAVAILRQAFKDAKVKEGTMKPYATAFTGYRQALVEGVNIHDTGESETGPSPLSAPKARTFNEGKERRAELKLLADVRAEIGKRVRAMDNLTDLIALRDSLPEVTEAVKTVIEPSAADMLAAALASHDEAQEEEEAQVA